MTVQRPAASFLSPRDLAAAIGASESSIKRWADAGEIAIARTRGGHRRIRVSEAIEWIRRHGHELQRPELLGLPDRARRLEARPVAEHASRLAGFLTAGEQDEARATVLNAWLGGLPIERIGDELLQPALATVGELWNRGPDGIALEHAATESMLRALHEIQRLMPSASGPPALGGGPGGDPYQLPSLLVALTLQSMGWRTVNLGADVPLPALLAACDRLRPQLVWLSLSSIAADDAQATYVRAAAAAIASRGASLIIGGRAMDPLPANRETTRSAVVESAATLVELRQRIESLPKR
ncbi:MAG: helix-turn-helix domain-containing protein [Planctomycetes bacterium]|nr:helix-turn-helix domain-containing protein [Planctomycetota bacterium]